MGGGVRDLLLGREPKDFDVATDASPEEVKRVFRNCRLIGRRFRLAHVHFGREIVEVATFRSKADQAADGDQETANGMLVRDNVYGTIEEDALRRDFTINALYYNIDDFSVLDYADGLKDLESGTLNLLGDPNVRYREDPVRMLRAVRFSAKLGFVMAPSCEAPLLTSGHLLEGVPAARLFDEVLKLFMGGTAVHAFEKLRHYDLFVRLFPDTDAALSLQEHQFPITFVLRGLENTDERIRTGKPVTPAFLFAFLLWEPVRIAAEKLMAGGESPWTAVESAAADAVYSQVQRVSIPRRFTIPMREIWLLQHRLEQRTGKRPHRLLTHPRFRAAYDFLLLRAEAGEIELELAEWWTRFQEADAEERNRMTQGGDGKRSGKRRRRRRKRKPLESPQGD